MPKFLLPIMLLCFVSLTGFGFVVLRMSPEQPVSVVLFLATLFLSLTFTLSLVFFSAHKKFFFKPKTFVALGPVIIAPARGRSSSGRDLRPLFRTSLRNAVFVAALATILLVVQRLW